MLPMEISSAARFSFPANALVKSKEMRWNIMFSSLLIAMLQLSMSVMLQPLPTCRAKQQ